MRDLLKVIERGVNFAASIAVIMLAGWFVGAFVFP